LKKVPRDAFVFLDVAEKGLCSRPANDIMIRGESADTLSHEAE
jgi:hypothetical protein